MTHAENRWDHFPCNIEVLYKATVIKNVAKIITFVKPCQVNGNKGVIILN